MIKTDSDYNLLVVGDPHLGVSSKSWGKGKNELISLISWLINNKTQGRNWILVINGDLFDLDHLEKHDDCKEKSAIERVSKIFDANNSLLEALTNFVADDNKLVLIIGNHDIDLWWPNIQNMLKSKIIRDDIKINKNNLIIEPWFYIYNNETYIEHGHLYDPDYVLKNHLNPFSKDNKELVLPLGAKATRFHSLYMEVLPRFKTGHATYPIVFYLWTVKQYNIKAIYHYFKYLQFSLSVFKESTQNTLFGNETNKEPYIKEESIKRNIPYECLEKIVSLQPKSYDYSPYLVFRRTFLDRGLGLPLIILAVLLALIYANTLQLKLLFSFGIILLSIIIYSLLGNPFRQNLYSGLHKAFPEIGKLLGVKEVIMGHIHRREKWEVDGIKYLNPGAWLTREEGFSFIVKFPEKNSIMLDFPEGLNIIHKLLDNISSYNEINDIP